MINHFNKNYHDRGTIKWLGMYLSEHTESMNKEKELRGKQVSAKRKMNELEIATVLNEAILHSKQVTIQLESIDSENQHSEDIFGILEGHDEQGIYVNQVNIGYDDIRHIAVYQPLKWSNLELK
ncbi:hypothetical protein ACWOFR_14900 [Carnobacterium gallinarum]|uniref:hypothetical protein n=1 Tax=Carnobacterium gallinarum TaxID=2749 RepID=UPI00055883D8|nr:hypothetical protein [Carnobacterium gallinarum]